MGSQPLRIIGALNVRESLPNKLKAARMLTGMSTRKVAAKLGRVSIWVIKRRNVKGAFLDGNPQNGMDGMDGNRPGIDSNTTPGPPLTPASSPSAGRQPGLIHPMGSGTSARPEGSGRRGQQ